MKSGQGFLLVFSITSLSSLHELYELREQIVRIKDDPNVPMVVVGNKSDLEEDRAVRRQDGFAIADKWGGSPYYETSAKRRANVEEAYKHLARQMMARDKERHREQGGGGGGGGEMGMGVGTRDGERRRKPRGSAREGKRRRKRDEIGCTIL